MNASTKTGCLVFLAGGLLVGQAAAGPNIRYDVAPGCPGEQEFLLGVVARGGRLDGAGRTLAVSVAPAGAGFQGGLVVEVDGRRSKRREVRGATCAEAVEALAIVAAMVLRPEVAPAGQALLALEEPAAPPRTVPVAAAVVTAAGPRIEADYAVTLAAGVAVGVVPARAMPVIDLSVVRGSFITNSDGRGRAVGPLFRFGLSLLADVTANGGATTVGGQRVSVGACLAPVHDPRGLVLLSCANLAAGLVGTRFSDTGATSTTGFGSVGLEGDARYNLGRMHVDLRLGVDALTNPISARRPDGTEAFHSSRFVGYGALGVGAHF
jgi:hypothetical protein